MTLQRHVAELVFLVFFAVLVRTAWISDDGMISLRTVMNVTHGNGLTFNIGERVQTFTHPLWLALLTGAYLVVGNVYSRGVRAAHRRVLSLYGYMEVIEDTRKYFIWRDENQTIHYAGPEDKPLHNLGFIPSAGTPPPVLLSYSHKFYNVIPVDLELTTADRITSTNSYPDRTFLHYLDVVETFNPAKSPAWWMRVGNLPILSNTEGGSMPSTIEQAAPYTPLNTSHFNNLLNFQDNNVQAAFEKLDDHTHGLPTAQAENDFIVSDWAQAAPSDLYLLSSNAASHEAYVIIRNPIKKGGTASPPFP